MSINIDYFLSEQRKKLPMQLFEEISTEILYEDIEKEDLRYLFSVMQLKINTLSKYMLQRSQSTKHFNAAESRELLTIIDVYKSMYHTLGKTQYAFHVDEEYDNFLKKCEGFLQYAYGSDIPDNLELNFQKEYEPVFHLNLSINKQVNGSSSSFELKKIGYGSYADVYKFKDELYNKTFALKRAKADLTTTELERFKREFSTMEKLSSPYILEVYSYNDEKNEYIMEYADETLENYISENPELPISIRKNIAKQIFRGFYYIHAKDILHRDISFCNILLKHYEDGVTVVKIADFGLVKLRESTLTNFGTVVKGSLNDSNLNVIGFDHYQIEHETYALTRLIYYLMTGKYTLVGATEKECAFVNKGISGNLNERYHNVMEMEQALNITW